MRRFPLCFVVAATLRSRAPRHGRGYAATGAGHGDPGPVADLPPKPGTTKPDPTP